MAVYFHQNDKAIVKNCTFEDIYADNSGTIYFDNNREIIA